MMILGTIIAACIGGALGYCAGHTKEMYDEAKELMNAGNEIINRMGDSFTEMNNEFDSLTEVSHLINEIKEDERTDEQKDILKKNARSQYKILARMIMLLIAGVSSDIVCVVASFILSTTAFGLSIIRIPFDIIFKIVNLIINKANKKLATEETEEKLDTEETEESEVNANAVDCEYCTEG